VEVADTLADLLDFGRNVWWPKLCGARRQALTAQNLAEEDAIIDVQHGLHDP
jgi:hypothetical protein